LKPRCGSPTARSALWVRTIDVFTRHRCTRPAGAAGIVDLHGDAFERQDDAPGVDFPSTWPGRQRPAAIGNGITRSNHATTGLGARPSQRRQCQQLIEAIESLRPQLARIPASTCATRPTISTPKPKSAKWLSDGRIDLFAFNDHMDSNGRQSGKPQKRSRMVERTGLSSEQFDGLVERVVSRAHDVPASITRLATTARGANVRMLSHDDESPVMRRAFAPGRRYREFPSTRKPRVKLPPAATSSCSARPMWCERQPHRLDQSGRHDRQGLMFDPCVRYYYRRRCWRPFAWPPTRAAAGASLGLDLGGARQGRRSHRSRVLAEGRRAVSSWSTTRYRCGRASLPSSPPAAGSSG